MSEFAISVEQIPEQLDKYFNELVSIKDKSETVEGEILKAVNTLRNAQQQRNLMYWQHPELEGLYHYLIQYAPDFITIHLTNADKHSEDANSGTMEVTMLSTLMYITLQNGNYTPNTVDCLSPRFLS